jgi:hypothetical protein
MGECEPAGVPEDAVLAFMKKAFELLIDGSMDKQGKLSSDDPTVNFEVQVGEAILVLTLSMGGIWKPQFEFTLLPVGLEKIDVLEAKLRDAQEEIETLKLLANEKRLRSCHCVPCLLVQTSSMFSGMEIAHVLSILIISLCLMTTRKLQC